MKIVDMLAVLQQDLNIHGNIEVSGLIKNIDACPHEEIALSPISLEQAAFVYRDKDNNELYMRTDITAIEESLNIGLWL